MPDMSLSQMALSGPMPGENLTQPLGNRPWQKPPQYTTVDQVMHSVMQSFQDKETVHKLLASLEAGAPMDTLLRTILMHGFSEGKWTYHLGVLVAAPLGALLHRIAKQAGVKYIPSYKNPKKDTYAVYDMVAKKKAQDEITAQEVKKFQAGIKAKDTNTKLSPQETVALSSPPSGGLMSPPSQGQSSGTPAPIGGMV